MRSAQWPRRALVGAALGLIIAGGILIPRTVCAVQTLTIDTAVVSFTTPSAGNFDAGYIEKVSATTATVDSDIDWKLTILGSAATWSCSGIECWSAKPRSDIEWRLSSGTYAALTGTAATVITGLATTPVTEDAIMDYKVLLQWTTDTAGNYDYDFIVLELSAI